MLPLQGFLGGFGALLFALRIFVIGGLARKGIRLAGDVCQFGNGVSIGERRIWRLKLAEIGSAQAIVQRMVASVRSGWRRRPRCLLPGEALRLNETPGRRCRQKEGQHRYENEEPSAS